MGCDIHLYQEKRVNGKWVSCDEWVDDSEGVKGVPWKSRLYADRSYRTFAVLADVRNGVGFAGTDTGTAVTPICAPRGIPDDCSPEVTAEIERWNGDGHSHSWLTLADITGYNWDAVRKNRGLVKLADYREWKAAGTPNPKSWCADAFGRDVKIIDEADAESASGESTYVRAYWGTRIGDDSANFLNRVVPRLTELENECGKDNARIVFFFDN